MFEQGSLRFHSVLGPTSRVAGPDCPTANLMFLRKICVYRYKCVLF